MAINGGRPERVFDQIVMVASLGGGLRSVASVLRGLPVDFPVPVIVLQHGAPRDAPEPLTPLLQRHTDLPVCARRVPARWHAVPASWRSRTDARQSPVPQRACGQPREKGRLAMARNIKIDSTEDVVAFLKSQHEEIKGLFTQVTGVRGEQRKEIFTDLRRLLAVHETAEEQVVHPRAKSELDNGKAIVSARLQEEHEAKEVLAELEKLDVDSTEFEQKFSMFRADVVAHAEAEEREEFGKLAATLDDRQLHRMRRAAELAEKTAPTHPHPGVESRAANLVAGPFAAMMDRAKDLISGS